MAKFTDYLGNPIRVGDVIVYPTCSGSSAADLNKAVVTVIDELVPINPHDETDRGAYLYSERLRAVRPRRVICGHWVQRPDLQNGYGDLLRDDSKAYMLHVKRIQEGSGGRQIFDPDRTVRLKNVDRVVVVGHVH